MASGWSAAHGSRFDTAATAPATTPRADVAADASVEGFAGAGRRLDRDAAARTAVFRFDAFVLTGARLVARAEDVFLVARLRLDRVALETTLRARPLAERVADFFVFFPELLVDFRLATPASHPIGRRHRKSERRRAAARQAIVAQDAA
jgi:hypothetical protein